MQDLKSPEFSEALYETLKPFDEQVVRVASKLIRRMVSAGVSRGVTEPNMFDESDYGDEEEEEKKEAQPSKLRLEWERIDPETGVIRWVSACITSDRILLVFDDRRHNVIHGTATEPQLIEIVNRILDYLAPVAIQPPASDLVP